MTRSRQILLVATMTLVSSSMALAQLGGGVAAAKEGKLTPPTPQFRTESGGEVGPIIWTVLLVGLGVGVNLIPTKRGHQD